MEKTQIIENFFGVYLLYCVNPKYKGRVYIGFTVDPNRRVKQHNKGKQHGGAWKTSKRGPWLMVLIVHGFPSSVAALQFEWAWQHPHRSRRLHHVARKRAKEKVFEFSIRVLSEMLQVGPWKRLPLTIRWLNDDFICDLNRVPPLHIPICSGAIVSKKIPQNSQTQSQSPEKSSKCYFCQEEIVKVMKCLNPNCDLVGHVVCFSKCFLEDGEFVPIQGECPKCYKNYLWGDLVRKFKGCYNSEDVEIKVDAADQFYSSDSE